MGLDVSVCNTGKTLRFKGGRVGRSCDAGRMRRLLLVLFACACTPEPPAQTARLRIVNGCSQPLWIFDLQGSGRGSMKAPHQLKLAANGHYDFPIPEIGLAATRFWAGSGCDDSGNNCTI